MYQKKQSASDVISLSTDVAKNYNSAQQWLKIWLLQFMSSTLPTVGLYNEL